MSATTSNVVLLSYTPRPLDVIYAACRQCYSSGFVGDGFHTRHFKSNADLIRKIMESGHESPIEHVSFTFAIEGISRALSHQLVRSRIVSHSQQSQRYVDGSDFRYIVPPAIANNDHAYLAFIELMEEINNKYSYISALLKNDNRTSEQAKEDARFVLPQATETRIVTTMNCRALLNFFSHRCCNRAQWEIRGVANKMLKICRDVLPEVFEFAGAKCEKTKTCPEGSFCCGRFPRADLCA